MFRLVLIAFVFALACGGDSGQEKTEAPAASPPAVAAPALSDEASQRLADLNKFWEWPEGTGEKRDLLADDEACGQKLQAKPEYKTAPDLAKLLAQFQCMQELGWEKQEGATIPKPEGAASPQN